MRWRNTLNSAEPGDADRHQRSERPDLRAWFVIAEELSARA